MKTPVNYLIIRIFPVLFLLAASAAFAGGKGEFEYKKSKQFNAKIPIEKGFRVEMAHSFGDVTVTGYSGTEVIVDALIEVESNSEKEALELLKTTNIRVEKKSDHVSIETEYGDGSFRNISRTVTYTIRIPETSPFVSEISFGNQTLSALKAGGDIEHRHGDLQIINCQGSLGVSNQFGQVKATGITGNLNATVANGNSSFSEVTGNLTLETRFGNSTISTVKGNLDMETGNGNMEIENVGGSLSADHAFGNLTIQKVGGKVTLDSRNGDVKLTDFGAGSIDGAFGRLVIKQSRTKELLEISNQNGDLIVEDVAGNIRADNKFGLIRLTSIAGDITADGQNGAVHISKSAGNISVSTSFSPVTIKNSRGNITVNNQNGNIEVTDMEKAGSEIYLKNSFASIELEIPSSFNGTVNASTTFGSIKNDFDMSVREKMSSVTHQGKIGSGTGTTVSLNGQNGSIYIRKK